MRIDLPGCGFKDCKYNFDCNCKDRDKYEKCEYKSLHNTIPYNYNYNRIKELIKADKEGRCVIPSCKAGDTIYKIGYSACHRGEREPYSYVCFSCKEHGDKCDISRIVYEFVIPDTKWIINHMIYFGEDLWYLDKESALKAIEGK